MDEDLQIFSREEYVTYAKIITVINNLLDYVDYINNKRRAHSAALARNCCMNDNPRDSVTR
jgi:hypothetical protein